MRAQFPTVLTFPGPFASAEARRSAVNQRRWPVRIQTVDSNNSGSASPVRERQEELAVSTRPLAARQEAEVGREHPI